MVTRCCENCACCVHVVDTEIDLDEHTYFCRRFPKKEEVDKDYCCFEHRFERPAEDVLETEIKLLHTSPRTRRICSTLKLRNVEDVLLVGKHYITYNGKVDKYAIRELSIALAKIGVDWDVFSERIFW